MTDKKTLRRCKEEHYYYKNSNCPICSTCEKENKYENGLFSSLSAPARRALENKGITTIIDLSKFSEKEILQLHGIGKTAIPKLVALLQTHQLKFRI